MKFLTVTSHPDDEILGFGGSTHVLTQNEHQVTNLMLSGNVDARTGRPTITKLHDQATRAQEIVGAQPPIFGPFPNIKFNTVPHLDLVQFIEATITDLEPDCIVTHHPYDLNNDHYHTSKACQAAARLYQRRPLKPLSALYFMEIPSSTDWSFPVDGQNFSPTAFLEIGAEGLKQKLLALEAYEGIMRPFPHSRSTEVITGLAAVRGAQAGRSYCEAFQVAMQVLNVNTL